MRKKKAPLEKNVHQQVCDYLSLQYQNVIFFSDASGMRVGMGLRMELKRKRCKKYKVPDLIIDHPSGPYHGLRIEVKRTQDEVFKKDGGLVSDKHIQEQAETLKEYTRLGYKAEFGCGFDHCKVIIDEYMKLSK